VNPVAAAVVIIPVSNYPNYEKIDLAKFVDSGCIMRPRFHVKAAGFVIRSEVPRRAVYLFTNTRTGNLKKLSPDAIFFLDCNRLL
jgi:hypothetical protein